MAKLPRSEKLARLVRVQRQLENMAQADLASTTRARAEIQRSLDVTVEALGSLSPVHQIFTSIYATQIGRLTSRDQHLATVQEIHEGRMRKERAKGDRLDEHRKEALTDERREADDNAIYDLIEQKTLLDRFNLP
ncbi:hypothetical protein [Rhizobium sp. FKL33]|uniref:hypothetical protein n=1 Tax=Rhizobium sp. FKL33 TaxID=2562307 RepID=UPI0010C0949D|nr:hypothetical protein [Rhizobium sp. FKL33]